MKNNSSIWEKLMLSLLSLDLEGTFKRLFFSILLPLSKQGGIIHTLEVNQLRLRKKLPALGDIAC